MKYTQQQILDFLADNSTDINGNTITQTWNGDNAFHQPLIISYSFFSQLPSYYLGDSTPAVVDLLNNTIDPNYIGLLSPKQQAAFLDVFQAWKNIANITFDDYGLDNQAAVIAITGASFKLDTIENRYPYADTQRIGRTIPDGQYQNYGDIWINTTHDTGGINNTLLEPGQDGYQTLLHEKL